MSKYVDGDVPAAGLAGRVIVVTGASSGLGEQLARALAACGAVPVLAARRTERLKALQAEVPQADMVACDVTRQADRERLMDTVIERHGRIDGLVSDAGMGAAGPWRCTRRRRHLDFCRSEGEDRR